MGAHVSPARQKPFSYFASFCNCRRADASICIVQPICTTSPSPPRGEGKSDSEFGLFALEFFCWLRHWPDGGPRRAGADPMSIGNPLRVVFQLQVLVCELKMCPLSHFHIYYW